MSLQSERSIKQTQSYPQEEWHKITLGQLVTFHRGYDLPLKDMVEGQYPVVGSNGIIGYHNHFKMKGPGVVVGRSGNLGKPFFVERDYWPHNTSLYVSEFHCSDPHFVYYFLKTLSLGEYNSGSAVPTLNRNFIHTIEVIVPKDFEEQKAIGKMLSELDSKIELNQQMNKTLEAVGQAVFKRWFVDFDFPNEEGKPCKSSGGEMVDAGEIGKEIPKGWKVGRIEDVADVVGGGTPSTKVESYFTNTGIHWLTPKDLSGFEGKFIDRGATDITEEGLKNSSAKLTPKGTILFTSRAPIGYIAIALNSITTNQGFKSLIPKNEMQTEYLYQYLRMITPYVQSISCGSTFGEISGKAMKGIEIVIPEKLVVKKFEEFMAPVNSRIINNIFGVRTLKEIRDSLLPRLMSGRIRVPVEERMADNRK